MTQLPTQYIEYIHDVLVSVLLPYDEYVNPREYRSRALLESAAARPFQTAGGFDVWPTLPEKAAAFFHSLACNHCFINGNKRTAVIALDIFLSANGYLLTMTPQEVYDLAKVTVRANQEGRSTDAVLEELIQKIRNASVDLETLKALNKEQASSVDVEKLATHVFRTVELVKTMIDTAQGDRRLIG